MTLPTTERFEPSEMTSAELAVALNYLGLNARTLAEYADWDARQLRRELSGKIPVMKTTEKLVQRLTDQADKYATELEKAIPEGGTLRIPRASQTYKGYPGGFWHTVADLVMSNREDITLDYLKEGDL